MDLSQPLAHPTIDECAEALRLADGWALNHFATIPDQVIGRAESPRELQRRLGGDPPASGRPFPEILEQFRRDIAGNAFSTMHPRFLAFVPGSPSFPSMLGDWLATASNFFAGVWLEASGPTQVELTVLEWFKSWLGYPVGAAGIITSGGSEANLTALVVARERVPWEDRGRLVLYVSAQRHSSIDRAAKIIGLHRDQIRPIPDDADFRLRAAPLLEAIRQDRAAGRVPWLVAANAGATNTGTVDPLAELAICCRDERLWLHVDASYGWAAILCEIGRSELRGIEQADSIALDPHKWLAQTFEAGCVLVRLGHQLEEAFSTRPDYLQDVTPNAGEVNFADRGLGLTRRFRSLKIWVSMQMLGLNWFRDLAERCCLLAGYAQQKLEEAGCFEILCPRRLSIVCFRYVPKPSDASLDELNERIGRELMATGRAFLSSTRLRGQFALRMCFISWRTTSHDVDEVVELLGAIGRRLA